MQAFQPFLNTLCKEWVFNAQWCCTFLQVPILGIRIRFFHGKLINIKEKVHLFKVLLGNFAFVSNINKSLQLMKYVLLSCISCNQLSFMTLCYIVLKIIYSLTPFDSLVWKVFTINQWLPFLFLYFLSFYALKMTNFGFLLTDWN